MRNFINIVIPIGLTLIGLTGLFILLKSIYVQAKPNEVVIITGLKAKKRTLVGKGGLVVPFFEKVSRLSLEMVTVDVQTSEAVPTADYIDLNVDAVAKVKIPSRADMIDVAAENFLNKSVETISEDVQDVLEGNMREIVGQMRLKELVNDRKAFVEKVQENAIPDLAKMGLEIVTFNVQNFRDSGGIIKDLGIDNVAKIKKEASIARQEAEKEVKINQAKADLEANEAIVNSKTQIAERENQLAIKKAELAKIENKKQAEAEAAYKIAQEEQRKTHEEVTANANAVKAKREIEIKRDRLAAEKNNEEDAKLYAAQKEAEAIRAVAQAKAEAAKLEAEAEAAKVKLIGEAEADKARAVGIAEAEALLQKAEAMKQYGEAAVLETVLKAYVDMSANIVKPLEKVGAITMYGSGNQAQLVGDTTKTLTQLDSGLKDALGIDIKSMLSGFMGTKLGVEKALENSNKKLDSVEIKGGSRKTPASKKGQ